MVDEMVADTDPFTVILFTEPLARELWRYKQYVHMRRVEIVSELDEIIFRVFGDELNRRMSEYLRTRSDPDNTHLKVLVRSYYPQGEAVLKSEYKERYPRCWKKRLASKKYTRRRVKLEKKRRYEMPEPFGFFDTLLPQQYYFMRNPETFTRGCSIGSGTRENHSYYALAFIELSNRLDIPTFVLVYDKDNALKFVEKSDRLLVLPDSMGSNCDVDHAVVRRLMKHALKVEAVRRRDYAEIKSIRVYE